MIIVEMQDVIFDSPFFAMKSYFSLQLAPIKKQKQPKRPLSQAKMSLAQQGTSKRPPADNKHNRIILFWVVGCYQ